MKRDIVAFGLYSDRPSFESGIDALRTAGFRAVGSARWTKKKA
jgi:hypothetical protein